MVGGQRGKGEEEGERTSAPEGPAGPRGPGGPGGPCGEKTEGQRRCQGTLGRVGRGRGTLTMGPTSPVSPFSPAGPGRPWGGGRKRKSHIWPEGTSGWRVAGHLEDRAQLDLGEHGERVQLDMG